MALTLAELTETGLRVALPTGPAYFNHYWLRDACPSTIDAQTRERVFDIAGLAQPPRARAARIEAAELVVEWSGENHVTRLPLALLESVAMTGHAPDPAALPQRLWYGDHYPHFARLAQADVLRSDDARARLARALIEDGIALVTDMPDSDEGLDALVTALGPLTATAEGLHFDVRLEIAPTNLAFTARALEMHTDMPGEDAAPGIQFLHCRANTVDGGRSLFLDGAAVAEAFAKTDPEGFALLAEHPIPFFYRHDGWDYRGHQRVIERDSRGRVTGVTISQHLQDMIDLPQQLLDTYYPAFCRFLRMLQEDRFLCRFRLNAGECIVFDNHRIVHGREAYSAESGTRHLRGCYTDRGALRSTYRVLAARGCDGAG
jgi:gamma-butyrobetaine dioxygenase